MAAAYAALPDEIKAKLEGARTANVNRGHDAYGDDHHGDRRILDIVDRIDVIHESAFDPMVPKKMPHGVDPGLKDGTVRTVTILDSLGTPEKPLSQGGVVDKARALVGTIDPEIDLDQVISTIEALPQLDDISELTGLLTVPSYNRPGGSLYAERRAGAE